MSGRTGFVTEERLEEEYRRLLKRISASGGGGSHGVTHEAGGADLVQDLAGPVTINENGDVITLTCTTTNAYIKWSDGVLYLETTETDANAQVCIRGEGAGRGYIRIYDDDNAEYLIMYVQNGKGVINLAGPGAGNLDLFSAGSGALSCFGSTTGNPIWMIHGYCTAQVGVLRGELLFSDTYDEFYIQAQNSVNHEGITVNLQETNQRFRIRQNSDYIMMYLTTTSAYIKWSDGRLYLMTDEGTNSNTEVRIAGKGTGSAYLDLYDGAEGFRIQMVNADGGFDMVGASPGRFEIYPSGKGNIRLFTNAGLGSDVKLEVKGYSTVAGNTLSTYLWFDDANDEFNIQSHSTANHEGITISLQETNQRFRIRQNSDYIAFSHNGTDATILWSGTGLILSGSKIYLSGIATTDAGDYALKYDTIDGIVYDTSDIRQKSNIKDLDYGLSEILKMKPRVYDYHNGVIENDKINIARKSASSIGLVAQEMYEIIPEIVFKPVDENKAFWGLDKQKLIPVIINAIQELNAKLEALEKSI